MVYEKFHAISTRTLETWLLGVVRVKMDPETPPTLSGKILRYVDEVVEKLPPRAKELNPNNLRDLQEH